MIVLTFHCEISRIMRFKFNTIFYVIVGFTSRSQIQYFYAKKKAPEYSEAFFYSKC